MWPWSTIKEARADAEKFALRCGNLAKENESLRQRWTTLNESYEAMAQERNQWEASYQKANALWESAHDRESRLLDDVLVLRAELAEAQRNDKRDPKSGRFVKAPKGTEFVSPRTA